MSEQPSSDESVTRRRSYRGNWSEAITDEQYLQKLLSKVTQDGNGCWIYQGWKNWKGYGQMGYRNSAWFTHRLSYMLHFGPIPDGMQVLHTCDVRDCCNPLHLFIGTNDDNMADKTRKGRHHESKVTHCPRGHEYSAENTYRSPSNPNARGCRICQRIRMRMKAGWTEEQATALPPTPAGHRPVNAPFKARRKHG